MEKRADHWRERLVELLDWQQRLLLRGKPRRWIAPAIVAVRQRLAESLPTPPNNP